MILLTMMVIASQFGMAPPEASRCTKAPLMTPPFFDQHIASQHDAEALRHRTHADFVVVEEVANLHIGSERPKSLAC